MVIQYSTYQTSIEQQREAAALQELQEIVAAYVEALMQHGFATKQPISPMHIQTVTQVYRRIANSNWGDESEAFPAEESTLDILKARRDQNILEVMKSTRTHGCEQRHFAPPNFKYMQTKVGAAPFNYMQCVHEAIEQGFAWIHAHLKNLYQQQFVELIAQHNMLQGINNELAEGLIMLLSCIAEAKLMGVHESWEKYYMSIWAFIITQGVIIGKTERNALLIITI